MKKNIPNVAGSDRDLGLVRLSGNRAVGSATISGRVVDEDDNPIAGAAIWSTQGEFDPQKTDHRGWFILTDLPSNKKISIQVRARNNEQEFAGIAAGRDDVELRIRPRGYQLIGRPAPELMLYKWLNTGPADFEALRGKVVLLQLGDGLDIIDGELPSVLEAAKKYGDKGLYTMAVHVSLHLNRMDFVNGKMATITEQMIVDYLKSHRITIPFALDRANGSMKLKENQRDGLGSMYASYYCKGYGELFLIDKNGKVAACPEANDLDKSIEKLLVE
jgi:hypothetical protein